MPDKDKRLMFVIPEVFFPCTNVDRTAPATCCVVDPEVCVSYRNIVFAPLESNNTLAVFPAEYKTAFVTPNPVLLVNPRNIKSDPLYPKLNPPNPANTLKNAVNPVTERGRLILKLVDPVVPVIPYRFQKNLQLLQYFQLNQKL